MGGEGSGRKPDPINQIKTQPFNPIAGGLFLPNYSGLQKVKKTDPAIGSGGGVETDPIFIATSGSFIKTETDPVFLALSGGFITSETDPIFLALSGSFFTASSDVDHDATTNFLANEHLDWTTDRGATNIHAGNYTDTNTTDHTALSNIGTQTHAQLETAIGLNTAKDTNVTTNITVVEAPTNVDIQSSDGSNDTIAAADVTNAGVMTTTMYDEHVVNTAHALDNTQAHSDYLLNNASDTSTGTITAAGFTTTGVTLTGDHGTAATDQVVNVCYGTGDPPAANTTTEGALFVKYTA